MNGRACGLPARRLWLALTLLVACADENVDVLTTTVPPAAGASGAGGSPAINKPSTTPPGAGGATGGSTGSGGATGGNAGTSAQAGVAGKGSSTDAGGAGTFAGAGGAEVTAGAGGAEVTAGAGGDKTTAGAGGAVPSAGAGGADSTSGAGGADSTSGAGGAGGTAGAAGAESTSGAGGAVASGGAGGVMDTTGVGGAGSVGGASDPGSPGGEGGSVPSAGGAGSAGGDGFTVPTPAKAMLTSQEDHTCARLEDGRLTCWGNNDGGQLGLGDTAPRGPKKGQMGMALLPIDLGTDARIADVAAGSRHVCTLLEGGQVKCWGHGLLGPLGLGDTNHRGDQPGEMGDALPFVDLGTHAPIISLASGQFHTCALFEDGRLKCWGLNNFGQLGLGDTNNRGDQPGEMGDALPFVDLGTHAPVVSLVAGASTCALFEDGRLKCWGYDQYGQLGLGDTDNRGDAPGEMGDALPFIDLGSGQRAVSLAAGPARACAVLEGGKIKCWGFNSYGEMGLGDTNNRGDQPGEMGDALPFVDLGTGAYVVSLALGGYRSCALLADGRVKCWGIGGYLGNGQLTDLGTKPGEMGDALPFIDLGSGSLPTALAAGNSHDCALFPGGQVKCWGTNGLGQLGLGDQTPRGSSPTDTGDGLPFVDLYGPVGP